MTKSGQHPLWATVALSAAGVAIALLITVMAPVAAERRTSAAAPAPIAAALQPQDTGVPQGGAAPTEQVLVVTVGEYFFDPNAFTVKAGPVRAMISNIGERRHTFTVQDPATGADLFSTERINPGESVTIEFTVPAAGTYRVYCSVSDHAERGQIATLIAA